MSRKSFDPDKPLPPHGQVPAVIAGRHPCSVCGAPTADTTLSAYGARCYRCYEAYYREMPDVPAYMGDRTTGLKSWAYALKACEDSGERLSSAQRAMWRAALR